MTIRYSNNKGENNIGMLIRVAAEPKAFPCHVPDCLLTLLYIFTPKLHRGDALDGGLSHLYASPLAGGVRFGVVA